MYTHKLDSQKHKHFLEQGRTDPITGEPLQEGDQVVLCTICKSAFLKETWAYIGGRHCGSVSTLKEIPKAQEVRIKPSNEVGNIRFKSPLFEKDKRDLLLHLSGMVYPSSILVKHFFGKGHWFHYAAVICMIGLVATMLARFTYRKFVERIPIFRDRGIELGSNRLGWNWFSSKGGGRKLRYRDIESIQFIARRLNWKELLIQDKAYVRLVIQMKSGEVIETNFANRRDGRSAMLSLLRLRKQVNIDFELQDKKLLALLEEYKNRPERLRIHE